METSSNYQKRWLVLGVMCIVLFIISIDNTVLHLALPAISTGLGASTSQLQWIVDTYTLVFASLLITTGALGDRYGRRLSLLVGLALFEIGSLGAALSTSTNMLIAMRALLGVAGAVIMPSTLSIITDVFRDGRERAKAIALWSSIFSIGAGIGPIIGGFLLNAFEWSAVFYLNLPIVAIGILGGFILVPESHDPNAPKPDLPGVALSSIGVFALVFGVISAGERGWASSSVQISLIIAVAFLALFIWWETHSATPMMPLGFFKNMSFTGANVSLTISSFAMMGSMYFFAQFFQSVQGYSALITSLYMFPLTPVIFFTTMASVRLDRKLGTKFTVSLGLLFSGLGFFLFSQFARIDSPYGLILLVFITLGCGIGFTMSPATNAIMNSLPPNRAGIGSAMNDTTRQLGGALGVAVLGALMNSTYRSGVNHLIGKQGISTAMLESIRSSIQTAHLTAQKFAGDLANLVVQTSSQAFVDGMKGAFFIGSFAMLLSAVTAWMIIPDKGKASESENIKLAEE